MVGLCTSGGRLAALISIAALAACSNFTSSPSMHGNPNTSDFNVGHAQEATAAGGAGFTPALAKEYSGYASSLNSQGDYADADYFARKSMAAAGGSVVPPENNSNWAVPLESYDQTRTELASGRQRLVAALDGGGRDRMPAVAARAQERYDCWNNETEKEYWRKGKNTTCKADFLTAMAELERTPVAAIAPAAGPSAFRILFDTDKYNLKPDGQQVINSVAAAARANAKMRVAVTGKTDTVGSPGYNMGLSERRADAVRAALIKAGVPAERIDARYVGESQLDVPTADHVAEPRNRTVDITVQ